MGTELTTQEQGRFQQLEVVIEEGLKTFVEVGNALLEIRDSRLYRQEFRTFEDYCRDRWGMARSTAYQYIDAAATVENVRHGGHQIPTNERQARPLTKLEPEQQQEAWQRAVETAPNGRVTGAHVEKVVKDYLEPLGSADGDSGDIPDSAEDSFDDWQPPKGNMTIHYSSESDEWETPQELFDLLDDEFGFELDVCATADNAKCERFFSPEHDGLLQRWRGVCWMNPPYGRQISEWVRKAHQSALLGATVVCLVPARVDTSWWWDHCIHGEVRFLKGRLKFGGGEHGAPFPSAVVVFDFNRPAKVIWWKEWN